MRFSLIIGSLLVLMACSGNTDQADASISSHQDSIAYSIGMDIGSNLRTQKIEVNLAVLNKGLVASYNENATLFTDEEKQRILYAFGTEMRTKQQEESKRIAEENIKIGEEFLIANTKKDGVVKLPSGLQYKVITAGDGQIPNESDKVSVHYKGQLIDGTVFDNSYDRGKPATFQVTGVIKGWTEALQLMPVGSKWELFVPSELAYGSRGSRGKIQPNSTLIFEIELLGIE